MSSFNGFKEVAADKLDTLDFNPYKKIGKEWFLVTAGDESGWNTMTASWGFAGVMWGKNCLITAIRPQRYTKEFIDGSDTFSITILPDGYRDTLNYFGSVSGRDEDKIAKSGLTVEKCENTPYFAEGKLVLICRKMFAQEIKAESFIDKEALEKWYPNNDLHTLYVAEIVKVLEK